MTFWIQVLQFSVATILSTGIIVTILGFLSKTLVSHWFQKDLEKFKTGLTHALQQDIFRFSKMHERRADVIEKTYQKLYWVDKTFASLMSPLHMAGEETKEVKAQKAAEAANSLIDYFGEHRIYFNKSTLLKMDAILKKLREIWSDWMYREELGRGDPDYNKMWGESWRKITEELPALKQELEDEFKVMIGISD